jgi:hypothetical protein
MKRLGHNEMVFVHADYLAESLRLRLFTETSIPKAVRLKQSLSPASITNYLHRLFLAPPHLVLTTGDSRQMGRCARMRLGALLNIIL